MNIKRILKNLYNTYVEEIEEFEDEFEEVIEPKPVARTTRTTRTVQSQKMMPNEIMPSAPFIEEDESDELFSVYQQTRAQSQNSIHPIKEEELSELPNLTQNLPFNYQRTACQCHHCSANLLQAPISEKDRWGMRYVVCPTCRIVGRIEPNGICVQPSDDLAEMNHALNLFAQKGYRFEGFQAYDQPNQAQLGHYR